MGPKKLLFLVVVLMVVAAGSVFLLQQRGEPIEPIGDSFFDNPPTDFVKEQAQEIIAKVDREFTVLEAKLRELRGAGVDIAEVQGELDSLKSKFEGIKQLAVEEKYTQAKTEFRTFVSSGKALIARINDLVKTAPPLPPPPPPPGPPGTPPPGPPPSPGTPPPSPTGDIIFPSDAGVVNVKDYGAKGDGVTDDTAAIQQAITENLDTGSPKTVTVVYFPAGTYLVSDRIMPKDKKGAWASNVALQGQQRDKTIIKLKDNASGFRSASDPKAVLFTASEPLEGGGKDWAGLGEGNTAFDNFIFDLTVDTGSGNLGAIGIDYLANNTGTIRNVAIHSGDGKGYAGLAMERKWPGPAFVKNLLVEGFDYGVTMAENQYAMTFEHITLRNQRIAGVLNNQNVASIRDLQSVNSVPAIQNVHAMGLVTVIDSALRGGASSKPAIENQGALFARNVQIAGYGTAIEERGEKKGSSSISEFASLIVPSLFPSPQKSLALETRETPDVPWDPVSAWANVEAFGANGKDEADDTAGIQGAIDSGATTVYFPKGKYLISDTIRIRGNVRRITGIGALLGVAKNNRLANTKPLLRLEDGTHPVVLIEHIKSAKTQYYTNSLGFVEHVSSRTLVLRATGLGYTNTPGSGPLFGEDVGGCARFRSTNVWLRQANPEGCSSAGQLDQPLNPKLQNDNSNLWILGLKTEAPSTVAETAGEGRTEVLGGLIFAVRPPEDPNLPAFINTESSISLVYASHAYEARRDYQVQIQETRDGVTKTITKGDLIKRGGGSYVPLYASY